MSSSYELVSIPSNHDDRGSIAFYNIKDILDFKIERVYWLYNLTQPRGEHAHKNLKQFMFCPNGKIEIDVDDGKNKDSITLDSPNLGLIIKKPVWRRIKGIDYNSTLIVMASEEYDENDYIRSYEEFLQWKLNS